MPRPARGTPQQDRVTQIVEFVCVLVVVAAIAGLIWWIVANAGGGVLNQG